MHGLTPWGTGRDKKKLQKGGEDENIDAPEARVGGTCYRIYNTKTSKDQPGSGVATYPPSEALRKRGCKSHFPVSPVIENHLRFHSLENADFEDQLSTTKSPGTDGEEFWELRTEAAIPLQSDPETIVSFRCHPNYRNEGPWYDWAIIDFGNPPPDTVKGMYTKKCIPSKILAFAEDPNGKGLMALVHGCNWRTERESDQDSVLVEHWQLAYHDVSQNLPQRWRNRNFDGSRAGQKQYCWAPTLTWISVKSILCPCLVVEEEPGIHEYRPVIPKNRGKGLQHKDKVLLVRPREQWPGQFTG